MKWWNLDLKQGLESKSECFFDTMLPPWMTSKKA